MDEEPLEHFSDAELDALARMLITMLRADGQASDAEEDALKMFANRVRLGEQAVLQPYLDRAATLPVSREEFARAARTITDKAKQQAIYAALYDVSVADLIVSAEWDLLKILVDGWDIDLT